MPKKGPPPEFSAKTLIEAARAALAQSRLEDAELLLDGVKRGEGDIDELDFLYGTIVLARGGWEAAIARFRAILARDPTLVRVRLDLARAYFRAGRVTSDLPSAARDQALAFLDEVRRRKTWECQKICARAVLSDIDEPFAKTTVNCVLASNHSRGGRFHASAA